MASNSEELADQQPQSQRLQIYATSVNGVSPFWREKYEKDAKKYWDVFYKRHEDRFFKDRHYLDKEWGHYFSGTERKVVLEVGCGAGNSVFPLIATYPDVFVHACDFSPRAVNLVKTHKEFKESHVSAFVCDLTVDNLNAAIPPLSTDVVTMIFVLSAVSPEKMPLVLQNIKKVLRPNGYVLFRDYASGDLAQERLNCKDQKISNNFYVRGDGTRAFYFSNEFLETLFKENGFEIEELGVCCKQVENRSRNLVMNRRWVQAVFSFRDNIKSSSNMSEQTNTDIPILANVNPVIENTSNGSVSDVEIDMSEGLATDMFGVSPFHDNEIINVDVGPETFMIKVLSKEYQHTCKSTGLMLWESARLMAPLLAHNPNIISQKRVLELGCGCSGICAMVAAKSADLVIATDGDVKALDILNHNITSNLDPSSLSKVHVRKLEWGNRDHIEGIKELNNGGFDVILGTDVTYVHEAILPLFETARELIACKKDGEEKQEPSLILCHVFRRVDEPYILSSAARFGFRLLDKWAVGNGSQGSVIGSWFSETDLRNIPSSALNIMYFHLN